LQKGIDSSRIDTSPQALDEGRILLHVGIQWGLHRKHIFLSTPCSAIDLSQFSFRLPLHGGQNHSGACIGARVV